MTDRGHYPGPEAPLMRPNAADWTRTGFDSAEMILSDGVRVVRVDRGYFPEDGGVVLYLRVYGAPSPVYARRVAERIGRVTEADTADDGAASFAVVLERKAPA